VSLIVKISLSEGLIAFLMIEYLYYGAYPIVVLESKDKIKLLRSYFDSVIVRDFSTVP